MKDLTRVPKVAFATSGIAFGLLLIVFVCVLFAKGIDSADKVWGWPWPAIAWILALPVCIKYLARDR